MSDLPTPVTREEQFLNGIAQGEANDLPSPVTREEKYLDHIARNGGGGGGGTTNYNALDNKPQINSVELSGNKTASDLGLVASVEGKGLSTNDYSDTEKGKVADNTSTVEAMVNVNGAKNRLNLSLTTIQALNASGTWSGNTYTQNGATFTFSTSGDNVISVALSGTPSTDTTIRCVTGDLSRFNGHILSGCPYTEAGKVVLGINQNVSPWTSYAKDEGNGDTVSNIPTGETQALVIWVGSGKGSLDGLTVYPMLRDARISDDTYVPYAMTNRELTPHKVSITPLIGSVTGMEQAQFYVTDYKTFIEYHFCINVKDETTTTQNVKIFDLPAFAQNAPVCYAVGVESRTYTPRFIQNVNSGSYIGIYWCKGFTGGDENYILGNLRISLI